MIQLIAFVFIGFILFVVFGLLGWVLKAFCCVLSFLGEGLSGCLGCFVYLAVFAIIMLAFGAII